ncbi:MAG: transglutaminase domain-containing protein, partial [Sciscionella sp.]|nr:transglutaminase domain-containing protein [Sciscionella sp.]
GQLFALLCLAITLFTGTGVLAIFPGPASLSDLGNVLGQSMTEVQNDVPPVAAGTPLLCLITVSLGLVAVLVDALAVGVDAPAAAGLVLLCVYAVPAALADALLPWWCFAVGAGGFALLLGVDRARRHQRWRGQLGLPSGRGNGGQLAITVGCIAVLLALFAGVSFTFIGTSGRLPANLFGNQTSTGALGIKPFTTLRGMLDNAKKPIELFRVSGLGDNAPYLRSLTLRDYQPNQGWVPMQQMPAGVPATGPLPAGADSLAGQPKRVQIQPVNWQDYWLPVYGVPTALSGVPGNYRYDSGSGIVYSLNQVQPAKYTELAALTEPSASQLRAAPADYSQVDAAYRRVDGVSNRVIDLTHQITDTASTEFDKAAALYRYFTDTSNGFSYSTNTGDAVSSNALEDFLFTNKTGFCEQYASAMAVMLRAIGIPSRVAIGFTAGYKQNGYRTITSQDAHAWVEVYFSGYGWMTFDPTPLADGRGRTPAYLSTSGGQVGGGPNDNPGRHPSQPTPTPAQRQPTGHSGTRQLGAVPVANTPSNQPLLIALLVAALIAIGLTAAHVVRRRLHEPDASTSAASPMRPSLAALATLAWLVTLTIATALLSVWLAVVLLVACALAAIPWLRRNLARRRRLRAVSELGPGAADAAWQEVLAESGDRGETISDAETVRTAARSLARKHELDADAQRALRELVGAVERTWYGGQPAGPELSKALTGVRDGLARTAPLALRARLLPKSVLTRERADD